ncbi:F-box/LRR-repeat protein At3g26922-like [Beta vulgaris subsp. vulgaris]|uniref:F-box/LRR-repeat protein At3g26922-like n=1 Tax=Beta vulgaris subsp. vulgaris TaxID=3555 RepID=UPI002549B8E1|nr:F-box/LRR-repeat protein At3g26922-like [Beta vulgaris subsp. vulgaris]
MYKCNHKDRISKLPEEMIHHILSFLLIKDATQTSVLSKTWKTVCSSYKILQSLHFDENLFALELLISAQSGQEPKIQEIRDRFMNFVNNRLLTIQQQHSPVLKLTLNLVVLNAEFSPVDRLMNLVTQTKIEELCIFVQSKDSFWYEICADTFYNFPYLEILVSSKWLQSLTVRDCQLSSTVGNYVVGMYSSLKHLWLSHVMVSDEESISNLASSCPLIELLEFKGCTFGMETLTLSIFHKLKKASVEGFQCGRICEVDIRECVNLESFSCTAHLELLFNSDGGSNIRDLHLVDHPIVYEELTADFPLLEKAKIVTKNIGVDWFKAANYHLMKLEIEFNPHEIYVDCPNLRYFKYRGFGCKKVFIDCPNLRELLYKGDQVPSILKLNLPTDKCLAFSSFL